MPFWLKRITVCFRLLPFTTLTMVQLSFLLSICYPSRLSESDFRIFPHCPVGSTHSITGNKCHSRVTPNGGGGISAIQDMTFLLQNREAAHSCTADQHKSPCAGTNRAALARLMKAVGLIAGALVSGVGFCLVMVECARSARGRRARVRLVNSCAPLRGLLLRRR